MPAMPTAQEVEAMLTGPGGAFEIETEEVRGIPMKVFKNRMKSLRDIPAVAEGRAGVQDEGSQLVALALANAPLEGRDERYLVTDATTLPREYCRLGPA